MVPSYCAEVALPSRFGSGRGPSPQKRNLVGSEEPREALVERHDAIAFGTVGLVADDAVGKVAPAREHRDPGLRGGTLDFDRTNGDTAAEDADDLWAGVSVRPLQHPYQFAQDDRRHHDRIRLVDRVGGLDGVALIVPCQVADEDFRIDGDPRRPAPASIASCLLRASPGAARVAIAIDTIINLSVHSD